MTGSNPLRTAAPVLEDGRPCEALRIEEVAPIAREGRHVVQRARAVGVETGAVYRLVRWERVELLDAHIDAGLASSAPDYFERACVPWEVEARL